MSEPTQPTPKPPEKAGLGYSVEGCIATVLFVVLFIVLLIQIFGRTPLFTGPVWTEEAARWLWVWMAFFGIAEVERSNTQLRMGFLAEMMPAALRRVVFSVIDLIYLAVLGDLVWIGWKTVKRAAGHEATTLPVSDAVLYASALVGMVLVIHRVLRRILAGRSGAIEGDGA